MRQKDVYDCTAHPQKAAYGASSPVASW